MALQLSSVYKVAATPGTGLGIIATSPIPRGGLVIAESPLLVFSVSPTPENGGEALTEVARKVEALPEDQQQAFFSLHNFHGEYFSQIYGILLSNNLPMGGMERGGLFPVSSRFNHSCDPSACYSWNSSLSKMVVYAVKDIRPGEQITITYLGDIRLVRNFRQRMLLEEFRFNCLCDACNARPPSELVASDARRLEIHSLCSEAGSNMVYTNPARALKSCRRALQLSKEEGLEGNWTHLMYLDALKICVVHGDMARASAFAVLAIEAVQVCQGGDSIELKGIKPYVKHPEKHRLAGTSSAWRTRTKNTRKKDTSGFEQWLWSRAI